MSADTRVRTKRAWLPPPVRFDRVRAGTTAWVLLAVIGWAAAGGAAFLAVRADREAARMAERAGLTPVSGPGIEIVLTDAPRVAPGENPSAALIQDSDLVFLEMMLWYGGARAVAINGARLTAESTVTSSGPTIMIDGRRMVGPFRVVAVGDPRLLQGVLETRDGFADRMRASGFGVRITAHPSVTAPAWRPAAAR